MRILNRPFISLSLATLTTMCSLAGFGCRITHAQERPVLQGQVKQDAVLKVDTTPAKAFSSPLQDDPFASGSSDSTPEPGQYVSSGAPAAPSNPQGGLAPLQSWVSQNEPLTQLPIPQPAPAVTLQPQQPALGLAPPVPGTPGFGAGGYPLQPAAPPVVDPDDTPEMRLAWDAWHRRVATDIFNRFNFFAQAIFRFCRPMICRVAYTVTRDGQIQNLRILERSLNPMFDLYVTQVIQSMHGQIIVLQFPSGSRRQTVDKSGTFMQNWGGSGFRYTTGDCETISAQ